MTKPIIFALAATTFIATAAGAQTPPPQPSTQNNCTVEGMHNNMMPAIRPGEKPKACNGNTASSPPPSVNQNDATPPDQNKPGTQTRPSGNTTTTHIPGSENSQDTGPTGAPK